jgi:hypothetical protein
MRPEKREKPDLPAPIFIWQGEDGTNLLTVQIIGAYSGRARDIEGRVAQYVKRFAEDLPDINTYALFYGVGNHAQVFFYGGLQHLGDLRWIDCASATGRPGVAAQPEELWSQERHRSRAGEANLVTYRTPDFMLSSAQDYRPGEAGATEHLWQEKEIKSVANITRRDAREFLALAARIPIIPEVQEFKLSDANEALLLLKKGKIQGAAVLKIS